MAFEFKSSLGAFGAALALTMTAGPGAMAFAPAPPAEEPSSDDDGRALSAAASYVRMPALQTSVQDGRRTRGMLQVRVALDAPARSTRRLIEEREVWLQDAYAESLLIYGGRMYQWGYPPDAELIADMLQQDTDRLLGEGRAQIVLDTVVIHPR